MASRSSSVLVCLSVLGALVSACSVGTTPALPDLGFSFDLDGGSTAVDGAPPADAGPLPTGCIPEICGSGLDDNCDGRIEEGCACLPGEESACFGGTAETRTRGACQDGRMVCAEGLEWGTWGDCVGDVTAEAEECDVAEVDEDCDGAQNEGCECTGAEPIPCGSGVGICREGIQECLDGLRGECIGATAPGVEECNGLDDNCDGATDEALSRECGSAVGECATGTQTCIGGAWEACSGAREPADEACDSLDNDCDGMIDEELDRACGSAVGECLAGTQSCVSGEWAACAGETLPLLEECNGLDDDCDGTTDEAISRPCGTDTGECTAGTEACVAGAWGSCTGSIGPRVDACDGVLDENCDGVVDEGCGCVTGAARPCGTDIGACTAGTETCSTAGAWGSCTGAVGGAVESCNAIDDDCDGLTDESLTRPCGTDTGACTAGTETCSGGSFGACAGAIGPVAERCDGIVDDDCDGIVDDGCGCTNGATRLCGTDTGACVAGRETCNLAGTWGTCIGAVGPVVETCNGVDDDCDSSVDETLSRACGTDAGECVAGIESCSAGAWGTCVGSIAPRTEVCDGALDEDCDMIVDEGCGCTNGATRACGTDTGVCVAGLQTCSGGMWAGCIGAVGPGVESCNNLDDNCDGRTDESLSRSCGTDVGACVAGTETCSAGSYAACVGSIGPVAERCDGSVDDDCDGLVDDGCTCTTGTTRSCGTDFGACVAGLETCDVAGRWGVCTGGIGPVTEICDDIDNDCDRSTDEGLSRVCGTDVGACVVGAETCSRGAWGTCSGSVGPATELCDGAIDQDCDGLLDEGCVCINAQTRTCGTDVGDCVAGAETCNLMGVWGACTGSVGPTTEVCDGRDNDCDAATDEGVCITVPPLAMCPAGLTAAVLSTVTLSGSGSDPDGGTVRFTWTVTARPVGSTSVPASPTASTTSFFLDAAGTYTVQFCTIDDESVSTCCNVTIVSTPPGILHVELSWSTAWGDMDLHLRNVGYTGTTAWFTTNDCFYGNRTPDWGAAGAVANPTLDRDDLDGYGPENATITTSPAAGTYTVAAHYYCDRSTGGTGDASATVRIYCMGALVRTVTGIVFDETDEWVTVATVTWPSCATTLVGGMSTYGSALVPAGVTPHCEMSCAVDGDCHTGEVCRAVAGGGPPRRVCLHL